MCRCVDRAGVYSHGAEQCRHCTATNRMNVVVTEEDMYLMADLNRVLLTGTIGEPRIRWLESGKPELRLNLTVEQEAPFKLYVQVYCYGKDCERLAESLEAGNRVFIDGKLSWRSTMKASAKESKMVVTCYGVEVLAAVPVPAMTQN
jgi:hypothetical protein